MLLRRYTLAKFHHMIAFGSRDKLGDRFLTFVGNNQCGDSQRGRMPKKVRELKTMLLKAGFIYRPAKGSHTFWTHLLMPDEPVTIAGKDGDDAPRYLEKQVDRVLKKLEELKGQE